MDAPFYDLAMLVPRHLYAADARKALSALDNAMRTLPGDTVDPLAADHLAREVAAELGVEASALFEMLRVALRGNLASPGLFDTMAALGLEKVRLRIAAAVTRLTDTATAAN